LSALWLRGNAANTAADVAGSGRDVNDGSVICEGDDSLDDGDGENGGLFVLTQFLRSELGGLAGVRIVLFAGTQDDGGDLTIRAGVGNHHRTGNDREVAVGAHGECRAANTRDAVRGFDQVFRLGGKFF